MSIESSFEVAQQSQLFQGIFTECECTSLDLLLDSI